MIAVAAGLALLWVGNDLSDFGWGFLLGIPFAIGWIIGCFIDQWKMSWLAAIAVFVLLAAILTGQIVGLLCLSIAFVLFIVPMVFAVHLSRFYFKGSPSSGSLRRSSRALVITVLPLGSMLAEHAIDIPLPVETVETNRIVAAAQRDAWAALVFYEEVEHAPPLLARIGLPRPLHTSGDIQSVGDLKVCTYDTGHLKKRITALEPGRLLAFEVIEQIGIEDRSVNLLAGSFRFDSVGDGLTRITLTTEYLPLLTARRAWRPFEHRLTRTLHEHVLDGIEHRLIPDQAKPVTP